MRENGVDMPDPQFDGGRVTMQQGPAKVDQAKMRSAEKACAKYRDTIKPPEISAEEKAGVQAGGARALRVHARARHRLPGPDVRRERRRADPDRRGSGIDPESPEVPGRRRRRAAKHDAGGRHDGRTGSDEAPRSAARRRRGRRGRRRVVVAGGDDAADAAAEPTPPRATAAVERRDLVDRENLSGTLGYADAGTLARGRLGHADRRCATPGSVVTRGHSLYSVNGEPAAFLLYGALPAWRDFDVRG